MDQIIIEKADKTQSGLIHEIESGELKIPQFQRHFVWDISQTANLMDSILKSYPIGSFIYWRTDEPLRTVRNIGNLQLNDKGRGEFVNYVLDGQQRITSIFACIRGEKLIRDNNKVEDFSKIAIDLNAQYDEPIVIVFNDYNKDPNRSYVSIKDIMSDQLSKLVKNRTDEEVDKIEKYRGILNSYLFTGIQIKNSNIDIATEIFTRLNNSGKGLDLFEIMVAKTYDYNKNFDLYEKYDELISKLDEVGYGSVSRSVVLFLSSAIAKHGCSRKDILNIKKEVFIDNWVDVCTSIERAIDFLRGYGIPSSGLLPYDSLLVPLSYFFYHTEKTPSQSRVKKLIDFFWRISLTSRYSSSLEYKLTEDLSKIDIILKDRLPDYEEIINLSPQYVRQNGYFVAKNAFIKSFLALYAILKPKSFKNNIEVIVDGTALHKNNSKNYHHFFPINHMFKNHDYIKYDHYHNVVNITLVEDYINKGVIKDKAPKIYIDFFEKENPELQETLKTHLIGDICKFGIVDDDYVKFFNERLKLIIEEFKSRVVVRDGDIFEEVGTS